MVLAADVDQAGHAPIPYRDDPKQLGVAASFCQNAIVLMAVAAVMLTLMDTPAVHRTVVRPLSHAQFSTEVARHSSRELHHHVSSATCRPVSGL